MNTNELNQEILDKIIKVCVCKSISRLKIKEAIKSGAKTVEEVKKLLVQEQAHAKVVDAFQKFKCL